ncbi:rRNA maturation RNase YbeY [Chloroflexota bacterium]
MEIDVLIDDGVETPLAADWLYEVVEQTLNAEGINSGIEVGLVVTGQERVHQLNRDYRGVDEPTDVLAFAATEEVDDSPFVSPPDGVKHLGEVIISYPRAVEQAAESRHPVEREMAILIIHGVLHLLGYDHDEPEREQPMKAREAEILKTVEGGPG